MPLYSGGKFRTIILCLWALLILFCLIYYYLNIDSFSANSIAGFLKEFNSGLLFIYLAVSILRGLTLIPSTPFVIAGSIIFPNQPFLVLIISVVGIVFSCSMIYFFSNLLVLGKSARKVKLQEKIKAKIDSPGGFLFVFLWSFFPFAPTDLICFAAGSIKMNFIKFILAVLLGELIICSCYIYFGKAIFEMI